ncbi:hypothetical protein OBV_40150 [Oscillibacter valericigenes Sjm18-20]|nr:hypothetical protein OBV_40150 [Oscillibacter valericigenes Sjm18-20]
MTGHPENPGSGYTPQGEVAQCAGCPVCRSDSLVPIEKEAISMRNMKSAIPAGINGQAALSVRKSANDAGLECCPSGCLDTMGDFFHAVTVGTGKDVTVWAVPRRTRKTTLRIFHTGWAATGKGEN